MNGLRQVWRDINRTPFQIETEPRANASITMPEQTKFEHPEPVNRSIALGSSKPRILIARPKTKPLNRNDKIRLSLERSYPTSHKDILDQAYAAYYYQKPATANLPELYELLESGFLDQGIEACGLHSWVIGRTK